LLGAAAFALGVVSAGATAAAIYLWHDVGQYRASLPAHATEGAMGFSLHFCPWLLTLGSGGVGIVAVAFFVASCISRRSAHRPQLTLLHIGTALSLLPLFYLVFRLAGVFLR